MAKKGSSDITYIPMRRGFLYLVAILDRFSRHVLAWQLSNTLGWGCMATSGSTTTSAPIRAWATEPRPRCTMPERCLAGLLVCVFDQRKDLPTKEQGRGRT